jgi:hypothetical protein
MPTELHKVGRAGNWLIKHVVKQSNIKSLHLLEKYIHVRW